MNFKKSLCPNMTQINYLIIKPQMTLNVRFKISIGEKSL